MKIIFVSKNFERKAIDLRKCDPEERVMMIDVDRCISCGSCELACQLEHSDSSGNPGSFRPIWRRDKANRKNGFAFYLPLSCRHCKSPCEYYSPYNFWINCPNANIRQDELLSCDICADRLQEGMWPACATRCTMKTIYFGRAHDVAFTLGEKRLREMGDAGVPE